jgi:L-lysine 6-transaminase
VIALATGPDGVRFRPALNVSHAELDAAIEAVRAALAAMA